MSDIPASFSYTYDVTMRTLVYNRFGSLLNMSSLASTDEDRINKGVILCPKNIALRMIAEKRGETFLDFINIYRTRIAFSWPRQRSVVARRGFRVTNPETGKLEIIKADAVDIEYSMWFWSDSLSRINTCIEKYIQWQHETPKITLTYDDNYTLNPDLWISPVADESQIEDIFGKGKIWVFRMSAKIDGWLPKTESVTYGKVDKIRLTLYDKDEVTSYSEIIIEDANQDTELEDALRMLRTNLYRISGVDLADNSVSTPKDRTSDFPVGTKIIIENSTANNEMYTVVSSLYSEDDDETEIVLQEILVDDTADGNVYKHEGG